MDELRSLYLALARAYHPDLGTKDETDQRTLLSQVINIAYAEKDLATLRKLSQELNNKHSKGRAAQFSHLTDRQLMQTEWFKESFRGFNFGRGGTATTQEYVDELRRFYQWQTTIDRAEDI